MANTVNVTEVKALREKVSKAKSIVITNYQGLTVNQVNDLREQVRQSNGELQVTKNTLLKIALKEEGINEDALNLDLDGPTATVFSYQDAIANIKLLVDYAKNNEKSLPLVKGGIVDGKYTNKDQLETLSKLPSKEVLIAQLLGVMKHPLTGIVNVLSGSQRKFVTALAEIAKNK